MVFSVLSAILSSDQDGLVGICFQHVPVGPHSNSKDMRLALIMPLTNRQQFGLEGVDWDSFVTLASPDADNFQVGHSVAITPNRSFEVTWTVG